jgi:HAE1 family hydrophobic/amphiphilic exporter-1
VLADRTQNIRASEADVEFTLMLTIALVVGHLRVPAQRAGHADPERHRAAGAAGHGRRHVPAGLQPDNLSLMALTIAVGFVVDDAIVMLENIYRHVEAGMSPLEAALQGAGEIAFTIVSISVSLVAVFIPLLLMGGIVGRLFREFAVTVTLTIAVSVIVSLTLTPMLCSRFLQPHDRPTPAITGGSTDVRARLRCDARCVPARARSRARSPVPDAVRVPADRGHHGGAVRDHPQGLLPAAGHRLHVRHRRVRAGCIIQVDERAHGGAGRRGAQRPGRLGRRHDRRAEHGQHRQLLHRAAPKEEGRTATADEIIARLRPKLAKVEGANLFLQAGQDINVGGRLSRTQYQYTLTDANLAELNDWAPRVLERFRQLPQLADVASDQQNAAAAAMLTIDRARASSFGITPALIDATIYDAIGQRQVAQYFTQINSYHVVLEATPQLQDDPRLFDKLYLTSPITGEQVPLSSFVKIDTNRTAYLSIGHQGQFPAVTISFNLAQGASLGDAVEAINKALAGMGRPRTLGGAFQGTAQAFGASLASQPYLIAAALIAVYIVLGLLYESYIHPLTILSTLPSAGVGALLVLMLGGYDFTVIALIGIILLIGIVKKNGIMMVDFALVAERERGMSRATRSTRRACCASARS